MWLWIVAALLAALIAYVMWLRPILRVNPWFDPIYNKIEAVELVLWKKSETIFFARLKMFVGLLLTAATQLGTIDITPLMPFVPDAYEPIVKVAWNMLPLVLTVLGWMDERLRMTTTKPIELVALPETKPVPAAVTEALVMAEAVKQDAVGIVQEAQAQGAV